MDIEASRQLVLWLYRQTCASWWCLEPFVQCFRESGWDGLQRVLRQDSELWQYSSRWEEFSQSRQVALSTSVEQVKDLLRHAHWQQIAAEQDDQEICLSILDSSYPERLRHIDDPPPVLWCSREISDTWWEKAVAVVGSRRSSVYGEKATDFMVSSLVRDFGSTIISGCAVGIDSRAHLAALQSGGVTLGVLGGELGKIPGRVRRLFQHEQAVLLSEWPPGFGGEGWNFARRNRLISGLAQVVLVVEAQEKSGTMLTVSAALEQGREVCVVPQSIWGKNATGVTKLANSGARLVLSAAEIVHELVPQESLLSSHSPEEESILSILRESNGEMVFADLLLAKPATISSSQWWQALHSLTEKGELTNRMGVVSLQ